jgi:hypothetical protein
MKPPLALPPPLPLPLSPLPLPALFASLNAALASSAFFRFASFCRASLSSLLLLTALGAGTIGFLPREAEGAGEADAPPRRTEATRLIAAGAGAGVASVIEADAVGSGAMFATGAVVI